MNTAASRSDAFSGDPGEKGSSWTVIKPRSGWEIVDLNEIRQYRDLFFFLVWRDIKVLYAQTILGFSWAVLQPLIQIALYSIVFGRVAQISTEGYPYTVFSTVALIPWTYIAQAMTSSSESLVQGQAMLGKVYFPRLFFPLTSVVSKLLDFAISLMVLIAVMVYYRIYPSWNLLYLPIFFLLMVSIPAGIGLLLSSLAVRYRDVKHAMPFVVRMLIYTAPIVYSASTIPDGYRLLYSFNPIVAVIEGYRACLLGTPIPWMYIWPGVATSAVLLVLGALYFRRMEGIFVDVM
jgi:lipopolysaccharide transport system permease protein